ncbi:prepilin-type N-terminal cleavage/methylation domain-containing protein [Telmatocola sphagniphila]|uniref:Prepilin-type N-terminal cleavage/methylation domain-containing protein n=1 Tax=Telmatocola sphagniphila TaxID=1123043 RepID=A0A8E6B447_9BACT|nr:prepilin-type N-terminal cleavage/methylation domain-containing protein [Telmatocola sphagniphila]QVL30771.1 prepilin-type N-terminal cleavage/methylation domain-containing protein [Telmatocola sphagniphila]
MKQYLKRGRRGFTLVEMLVSVALCMFIMLILTGAFQSGIDAFRILRSTGQMAEKLRIASAVIRRDVASQHFDGSFQPGLSGPYLSDQRLDKIGWAPPEMGYFRIYAPRVIREGLDSDNVPVTRAVNHQMAMTVKRSGTTVADAFQANMPGLPGSNLTSLSSYELGTSSLFASKWGEVSYFLYPNPNQTIQGAYGQEQLYTLYRRVSTLAPSPVSGQVIDSSTSSAYSAPEISQTLLANGGVTGYYNSPADVTMPLYSVVTTPAGSRNYSGATQPNLVRQIPNLLDPNTNQPLAQPLLQEVLSFEIRAIYDIPSVVNPLNGAVTPLHTILQDGTDPLTGPVGSNQFNRSNGGISDPADATINWPFLELPRYTYLPRRNNNGFNYGYHPGNLNSSFAPPPTPPYPAIAVSLPYPPPYTQVTNAGLNTNPNPSSFNYPPSIPPNPLDINFPSNRYRPEGMQFAYTFDTWTRYGNASQFPNLKYVNWDNDSIEPPSPTPYVPGNPYTDLQTNPANNVPTGCLVPWEDRPPMRIRIRALQIKLRVWDAKAGLARQVTIIQDV